MDPLVTDPSDPEPTIPQALLTRLLALFTPAQLLLFVSLCEDVKCETGHGSVTTVIWADRVKTIEKSIMHQA